MTYENFQNEFIENLTIRLKEIMPDSFTLKPLRPECHRKPSYHGLQCLRPGQSVCPIVNMDELYAMYSCGQSIDDMLQMVIRIFSSDYSSAAAKYGRIFDYEFSKSHIVYRLLNRERNAGLLEDVPHIDLLDLSIVFELMMEDEVSGGLATHLICRDLAEQWNVSADSLLAQASANAPRVLQPEIKTLSKAMEDILQKHGADDALLGDLDALCCPPVIVITNKQCSYGAAVILYKDVLKDLADVFEDDLYLIPSSVHEMLALPAGIQLQDKSTLTEMLHEVNRTELAPEDFLSDHVYYYARTANQLSYCCN